MILFLDLVLFRQVDEKVAPDDDGQEGDDEAGGVLKVGEDDLRVKLGGHRRGSDGDRESGLPAKRGNAVHCEYVNARHEIERRGRQPGLRG